ncbi:MAG TPA: PIN domain-containing protein [Candidatus Limnocylindria bacterium]|nr:PIN domain-containing protein [Candidatus Limnocylindria bacterium]
MIFVDTAFWVALGDRQDTNHVEAKALFRQHAAGSLVTTNHVRGETWTLLRRRSGHGDAVDFLDRLERSPRVRTIFVTEDLEDDAIRWLRRHDERSYSFVDAASFAVMRSLRITEALTFDQDFAVAGFRVASVSSKT